MMDLKEIIEDVNIICSDTVQIIKGKFNPCTVPGTTLSGVISPKAKKIIDESKKKGKVVNEKTIKEPGRKEAINNAEKDLMKKYHEDGLEHSIAIDDAGNTVLETRGTVNKVEFTESDIMKAQGTTFIHNHPNPCSFSMDDIIFANKINAKEIRVISDKYEYILKPKKYWPTPYRLETIYNDTNKALHSKFEKDFWRLIDEKGLSPEDAGTLTFQEHSHRIIQTISSTLDLDYKRVAL